MDELDLVACIISSLLADEQMPEGQMPVVQMPGVKMSLVRRHLHSQSTIIYIEEY